MKIQTSQGDVIIDILDKETNIGLRISGGTDSSLLLYLIAIFKRDYRPDIKIFPMTVVNPFKPYQELYSRRVIDKVVELTGVEIEDLFVSYPDIKDKTKFMESQNNARQEWLDTIKLDTHLMGETKNPSEEENENFVYTGPGRDLTRDGLNFDHLKKRPFRNIDKKGIAEIYEKFGLTDILFPITRSCEDHTIDFSKHCGICWFCEERKWGFGRYE